MLHALRSVQQAVLKGNEVRRISFRDIDVEQIGYIYEGLLGYTASPSVRPTSACREPAARNPRSRWRNWNGLQRLTLCRRSWPTRSGHTSNVINPRPDPSRPPQSPKALAPRSEPSVISGLAQAVGDDTALRERVLPWLGIMRQDLRGRPFVVLDGGLMVKETPSRKNAGAHYTPKSLAREVVLHALQPLCYAPGPYQTADESQWKLKSSDEMLEPEGRRHRLRLRSIPGLGGELSGRPGGRSMDRRRSRQRPPRATLHRRAIREVVANCLYGADINDMAVEMCKLSLWLVSLDRDLPFSFVDDKIFLGNSLLGLTNLDQLRKLHIDPSRVPAGDMFDIFDVDIDAIIAKAADLRRKLASEIDENDPPEQRGETSAAGPIAECDS